MAEKSDATESSSEQTVFKTEEVKEPTASQPEKRPETITIPEEDTPEDITLSDIGGAGSGAGGMGAMAPLDDDDGGGSRKKYIFIGAGVLFVLVLFFVILRVLLGFVSNTGQSNEPVTLEYWGLWTEEETMRPIIQAYQQDNPNVTINYTLRDKSDYREKLVVRGQEGRGPDIFRFHNTWLPMLGELAAPVPEDIMTNQEFEDTFYPIAQSDLKIGDTYHGIPLMVDGPILIYNNDLFKNVGVEQAPTQWDEVARIAQEIQVPAPDGGIIASGIALGTTNNIEHFSEILGFMFLQNGADIRNLSTETGVDVLSFYTAFAEPPLQIWNTKMDNNINAFIQGKVGMIIVPSWWINNILAAQPNFEVKATILPRLSGSDQIALASYWVEGVSAASDHQAEAWKFLKYLSEKETMTKLYEEQTRTHAVGMPYSRVDLRSTLLENEYIGPVLEQAPNMQSLPVVSRTFDNGLNDTIVSYLEKAVEAVGQGTSPQNALETASQGINQVLSQYNIE